MVVVVVVFGGWVAFLVIEKIDWHFCRLKVGTKGRRASDMAFFEPKMPRFRLPDPRP